VVLVVPLVVTFYLADIIFHHDVNIVESHDNWYNSHHDEKFHFCCTGRGIYQSKIPLVVRIFIVGAVRCKIKKPLAQPTVPSAHEPRSCATKRAVSFGRPYTLRRGVVRIVRHSPQHPGSTFCKLCGGEITCCWCYTLFLPLPLTTY
jgi:hypothetical protein